MKGKSLGPADFFEKLFKKIRRLEMSLRKNFVHSHFKYTGFMTDEKASDKLPPYSTAVLLSIFQNSSVEEICQVLGEIRKTHTFNAILKTELTTCDPRELFYAGEVGSA